MTKDFLSVSLIILACIFLIAIWVSSIDTEPIQRNQITTGLARYDIDDNFVCFTYFGHGISCLKK